MGSTCTAIGRVSKGLCVRTLMVSPAKINLGLSVVGRRPDGYHQIESVFWPLSLADTIEIEETERNSVAVQWATDAPVCQALPRMEENVVFKLLQNIPTKTQFRVSIQKRIPIGGGLGGGSSNAGAVLRFLKQNHLKQSTVEELALSLGADIPFFLDPVPTWVTGIGEKREPLRIQKSILDSWSFILIFPPVQCITKTVFKNFNTSGKRFSIATTFPIGKELNENDLLSYLSSAHNDLEHIVEQAEPVVGEVLRMLAKTAPIYSGLSGSGATCFAIYPSPVDAQKNLKDAQQFCRKYHCKSIIVETLKRTASSFI